MQVVQSVIDASLAAIIAAGAPLDPASTFMGIYTAIQAAGLGTTLANITEATGGAATRKPVTPWSAVYHLTSGAPVADGPKCTFAAVAGDPNQSIIGWMLVTAAIGGNLHAYAPLPAPVVLAPGGTTLTIIPRVTLDPTGKWSVEVSYNG